MLGISTFNLLFLERVRGRFEKLERAHEILPHTHHGPSIVEFATVVRGAKHGYHLPLGEKLVTVLHHLFLFLREGMDGGGEREREREREREGGFVPFLLQAKKKVTKIE